MRIEISAKKEYGDPRERECGEAIRAATGVLPTFCRVVDVFIVDNCESLSRERLAGLFADPVASDIAFGESVVAENNVREWNLLAEVTYKPGVTDPEALTAREAISIVRGSAVPDEAIVQSGTQYLIGIPDGLASDQVTSVLHNPLIQTADVVTAAQWAEGRRPPRTYPYEVAPSPVAVERIRLTGKNDDELADISARRLLALDGAEMRAIREYYANDETAAKRRRVGIGSDATDVELEMIAQTWSEHCKHKIFQATIDYRDGESRSTRRIDGLFRSYIKRVTDEVGRERSFLRSVFTDNSGVVAFDESCLLCFKAETHNSPSALDPYGGAITGIVGVNRDIIGTGKGARPIFNTDVLCFGYPSTNRSFLPEGILEPATVMKGVHRGIIDGGNQSGIPVVAGGFLFDESYTGKPLVYCGTGGILPPEIGGEEAWVNHVDAGDLAVMVGGRIGKDGIHGATFSSLDLSETSPTSAVQIGDPITQRKMLDFLLEARDRGLYKGITDNGAGGLSSSLGEMAERSGGIVIHLDRCPLKYPGLAPWEILVSESQERMSLAVDPDRYAELVSLAERRGVEVTAVGTFTADGTVRVYHGEEVVAFIDLDFLHNGLPLMHLTARWVPPDRRLATRPDGDAARQWLGELVDSPERLRAACLAVLSEPNVRSKEALVRQYDHEVQGRSVVKPFCGVGADGPSDGGVLRIGATWGITVTHGISPRYGDWDTYDMAACAVDEAVRAHVVLGGEPEKLAALDNFCWPNPIAAHDNPDGEYKLAQLVRANEGLYDTCSAYRVPLISGKDSMKNDSTRGGRKLSIRPTLLVSVMGYIPDVRHSLTTDFKAPGNLLFLLGATRAELGGTTLERVFTHRDSRIRPWDEDRSAPAFGRCPSVDTAAAWSRYESFYEAVQRGFIDSAHDLADGGLLAALCESAVGGGFGARVDLATIPESNASAGRLSIVEALFSESASRILVEVPPGDADEFSDLFDGAVAAVGRVESDENIRIVNGASRVMSLTLLDVAESWKGDRSPW